MSATAMFQFTSARRRTVSVGSALVLGLCLTLVPSPARAATASTYVIGVGAAPPAGQNIEYVDFFPRSGISVHNGDVIDLQEPSGASTDDTHMPALLAQGQTVQQAFADPANALVVADSDEPGSNPQQNIAAFSPTFPPAGSGAPGQCGDQTTPCVYNGGALLSAGAESPGTDFFVKLSLASGFTGTVTAVDLGHPISDPSASISVVADSASTSTQSALNSAAAAQYQADTAEASSAIAAASTDTVTTNANGTHNHTVSVGASSAHTEVMEMLPSTIHVSPGDTVTWKYGGTSDPHTVQFPGVGLESVGVSPFSLPVYCEGASADTLAVQSQGPPDFGCANATPEAPLLASAQGSTVLQAPAYRLATANGGVYNFGQATSYGSAASPGLRSPVVQVLTTGSQRGYWEVTANGGVHAFGDAPFEGSMAGKAITAPIISVVTGPQANGYVLVGSDGNTYSFGGAPQVGKVIPHLASPLVGAVADLNPSVNGPAAYAVSAGGGVFALLAATYYGSMGGKHLNSPMVGMASTPDGAGYWEVAADGGVFSFGDAGFYGSMGGKHLNSRIVGITPTPDGGGYWLLAADGGVFSFGDARFHGSMGGPGLSSPAVSISTVYSEASSGVLINVPAGNPNDLPSRTSYSFSFPDAGTYPFICGFHQMMTGRVVVG